jgi:hypothetical protein
MDAARAWRKQCQHNEDEGQKTKDEGRTFVVRLMENDYG